MCGLLLNTLCDLISTEAPRLLAIDQLRLADDNGPTELLSDRNRFLTRSLGHLGQLIPMIGNGIWLSAQSLHGC